MDKTDVKFDGLFAELKTKTNQLNEIEKIRVGLIVRIRQINNELVTEEEVK